MGTGEGLVVACVDNFWAKLDWEGGQWNGTGAGKRKGVFGFWWYICVLMRKISGEELIDQEKWVGSPKQKRLRSVGGDLAFPGGGTLPSCGLSAG